MSSEREQVVRGQGPSRREVLSRGATFAGLAVAGGGIASSLAACGSSGSSSAGNTASASSGGTTTSGSSVQNVSLQFSYLPNVQFMGSFFAEENGYYKQSGVNVTLLPGGPNLAPEPIVVSGKALVGITHTAEGVSAIAQGAPMTIIGATYQKSATCIISRAKDPIRTPKDMIGKKIGISATNLPIWKSFLQANHMSGAGITVVTVQFDPTPLATGEIDGLMGLYTNENITLELAGTPTYAFLLNDFNYPLVDDIYIARNSDLQDSTSRAAIVGLMRGESLGWSAALADPAKAAELAVTKYGKTLNLNLRQQTLQAQASVRFVEDADTKQYGLFWMTGATVAQTLRSLAYGKVNGTASMFSNEVLAEIYKGGNTVS